jgi:glycosyltransferase involved in cell wall biosynthesis
MKIHIHTSKKSHQNLSISLVIPAYNEHEYIGPCLEYALRNGEWYIDEIIVIDNASTDDTKKIAEQYDGVRVVTEHNKWLTFARQRGYKEAKGDIIAYIDADTHMPKWRAKRIKDTFESDQKIWFLSGPYNYYDLWWYKVGNRLYWRVFAYTNYLIFGYLWVGWNFAIKKSVLDQINWFDTNITFYGEDTDIARRAAQCSKAKFSLKFLMYTSARRFSWQGIWKTTYIYMVNFVSQALFHKSVVKDYEDFR